MQLRKGKETHGERKWENHRLANLNKRVMSWRNQECNGSKYKLCKYKYTECSNTKQIHINTYCKQHWTSYGQKKKHSQLDRNRNEKTRADWTPEKGKMQVRIGKEAHGERRWYNQRLKNLHGLTKLETLRECVFRMCVTSASYCFLAGAEYGVPTHHPVCGCR